MLKQFSLLKQPSGDAHIRPVVHDNTFPKTWRILRQARGRTFDPAQMTTLQYILAKGEDLRKTFTVKDT